MGEIINADKSKKSIGVPKVKKRTTRVDLTPMVDLGFLLITFFIFTTTVSQATVLKVNLPSDSKQPNTVADKNALTILAGKQDQLFYYSGIDPGDMQKISFKEIRKIILEKKESTAKDELVVIIKPSSLATYKNIVNLLDEMTIDQIKRFVLVDDLSDEEKQMVSGAVLAL